MLMMLLCLGRGRMLAGSLIGSCQFVALVPFVILVRSVRFVALVRFVRFVALVRFVRFVALVRLFFRLYLISRSVIEVSRVIIVSLRVLFAGAEPS